MKLKIFALALLVPVICVAQAPPAPLPSYKDLKYLPLKQVKIPEPATFTLSNGMRVFLLEDHELPLIRGLALVHTGNLFDPPDKKGLSELTASILRSGGVKSKTGDQIDEELENIAASVESSMEETSASLSFSALKETSDRVLEIFRDVVTQPEFRQDKLDLAISQVRSGISRRNDDADGIPDRELMRILYGPTTPYGWQMEYEDLDHIHRDDLVQFYRRYYFPKNIMLAVFGDFSAPQMKDKLEKLFASWTVEQPAVPPFPPVTAKPAGIYLAEKPDVTQTFFSIGQLGGTLRDKDYPALEVASNILGQGFSSRLVSEIRTKLGYAYNIASVWSANYNHPGTFRIVGSTKSSSTTETIEAIRKEVDKIRTAEVSERELEEAKQEVLNSFVFFFDSPSKTLNRVMRYEYFGYPKDFLFQYQKAIAAVTRADVLRVAKERIRPDDFAIVAVGNPKEFGKPLTSLGKVTPIDLTIPEPKTKASNAGPANSGPAKPDAANLARGRELLQRAQKAVGGAEKVGGVKDSLQIMELTMDAGAGGLKVKQQNRYVPPSYLRQDQELPFGKVTAYTDGKSGWVSTPQGMMAMSAPVLKQAQGEVFRNLLHLLTADHDPTLTVSAAGKNTVEISSTVGENVKVEFDESTGLPARETYRQVGMGAPPFEVEESFSDWREVEGLKVPFKLTLTQAGKKVGDAVVQDYKFNTGVKLEELSKKP